MKLVNDVLDLLGENKSGAVYQAEIDAFSHLLQEYGVDDVDVNVEKDGADYLVSLTDGEDSETLIFGVDEDDDAYCISADDGDELSNEADCVDLQLLEPKLAEDGSLDMTDLSWLNKSAVQSLFSEASDETDEKFKLAIRGGKKTKIPIKIRKKRLNAKQKAALAKARRKSGTAAALRKRAISNKIRNRMGLK